MPLRINHLLLVIFITATSLYASVAYWYWGNHIAPGILASETEIGQQLLGEVQKRLSQLDLVTPTTVDKIFDDLLQRQHGSPTISSVLMLRAVTQNNQLINIKRRGMTHDERFIFQTELSQNKRRYIKTAAGPSFTSDAPIIVDLELNPSNFHSQRSKWALITVSAFLTLSLPLLLVQLLVMRLIRPLVWLSDAIDKMDTRRPELKPPKALFLSREVDNLVNSLHGLFNKLRKAQNQASKANNQVVKEQQFQARQHIELSRAQRFICEFLAYSTEQVRGPLDAINNTSLLLEETGLAPRQREYCRNLQNNSAYLIEQLEDLKDYTRLEAGQLLLDPVVFSPDILLESLIKEFHGKAKAQQTRLSYWVDPELPTQIRGDRRRIRQILKRLINHSLSITRGGDIAISLHLQGNQWQLCVGDSGPNQSRLLKQQMMEPISGSGFGMTLLRGLAQRMGGRLHTSILSQTGNCYFLSLPLQAIQPAAARKAFKVLVALDDPQSRFCVLNWLERQGMQATAVEADSPASWPTADALISCESYGNQQLKEFRKYMSAQWLLLTEKNRPDIRGINFSDWPVCYKTIQHLQPDFQKKLLAKNRNRSEKLQLLLVDEHPISRRTLRRLLERSGFRVSEAESCREALEVVSRRDFDLMLADSLSDGYELVSTMRGMETSDQHMPALMMVNNPQKDDYQQIRSCGANGMLLKPVNLSRLKSSLEEAGLIDLIAHMPEELDETVNA